MPMTPPAVVSLLMRDWFSPDEAHYLRFHARRIAETLGVIEPLLGGGAAKVLDVGPHLLTSAVLAHFGRERVALSSLGFADDRLAPRNLLREHVQLDLNGNVAGATFADAPFDGVIFAETVEHVRSGPEPILRGLAAHLRPGGWLLLQTPNAVSLTKRWAMLAGRNPYELLRDDPNNPGHFREYTSAELAYFGQQAGLAVEAVHYLNYWRSPGWRGWLEDCFPKLRNGLTVVFRKR